LPNNLIGLTEPRIGRIRT